MLQVLLCQLTKTLDNPSHLSARWATASRAQAESRPGTSDTPSCNLGPVASPILLASCDRVYMVLKTIRSGQKQKLLPTLLVDIGGFSADLCESAPPENSA